MWIFKEGEDILAVIKKDKKAIEFASKTNRPGVKVANIHKKDWMDIDDVWDIIH